GDHRRVDHLVHRHRASPPALEAGARYQRVVAAGEEVGDLMSALGLDLHQVFRVGDEPAGAPWREAPADVEDAHGARDQTYARTAPRRPRHSPPVLKGSSNGATA